LPCEARRRGLGCFFHHRPRHTRPPDHNSLDSGSSSLFAPPRLSRPPTTSANANAPPVPHRDHVLTALTSVSVKCSTAMFSCCAARRGIVERKHRVMWPRLLPIFVSQGGVGIHRECLCRVPSQSLHCAGICTTDFFSMAFFALPRVFFLAAVAPAGRSIAETMAGAATACSFLLHCARPLAYQFSQQPSDK